jgi:uncharacterized delta-60 repeat protein
VGDRFVRDFGERRCVTGALLMALGLTFMLWLAIPTGASADNSMAIQPDGKIVLSGIQIHGPNTNNFGPTGTIVRLNPDGSLDGEFGVNGTIQDYRAGNGWLGAVAVRSDGSIVSTAELNASLFSPRGRPSLGFGENGIAWGPALGSPRQGISLNGISTAVTPLGDGSIAVGGSAVGANPKAPRPSLGEATLFDSGGRLLGPSREVGDVPAEHIYGAQLSDLLPLGDGSVAMTGLAEGVNRSGLLARFVPGAGAAYDQSFAQGKGLALFSGGRPEQRGAGEAIVGDDGKLLVGGYVGNDLALLRFNQDGTPDTGFGQGGLASLGVLGDRAYVTDLAVQADGKIVFAAKAANPCRAFEGCGWSLFVGRFAADGSALDGSFGSGGVVRITLPEGPDPFYGTANVAALADGKILFAHAPRGFDTSTTVPDRFVLVRLNADGSPDAGFGTGGMATALPCQGDPEQLRASGCTASATVRLRIKGIQRGVPVARLGVAASTALDPILGVQLLLPAALRGERDQSGRAVATAVGGRVADLHPKVFSRRVNVPNAKSPRSIALVLPRGVLALARQARPGHKLVFRVKVKFRDGSTQTVRVVLVA